MKKLYFIFAIVAGMAAIASCGDATGEATCENSEACTKEVAADDSESPAQDATLEESAE